jgi:hypothetical protein
MWHNPNQRLRAIANAKKREREKQRRPFHVKRVIAHLSLPKPAETPIQAQDQNTQEQPGSKTATTDSQIEIIPARVILNDLSSKGVGLFSPFPFIPGQEVIVNITAPIKLQLPSRVVWCQQHDANSHVLSSQPYSYRLGIEFLHPSHEKQESIKIIFDDISRNFLYSTRSR